MSNKQRMTREQEIELNEYMREENDFFIEGEKGKQSAAMQKQDEELDKLSKNVDLVRQIGEEIGDEIEKQGVILDDLGEQVENTDSRITTARRKIDEIIEKSSNWKIGIFIGILVVILIVIIILIFAL